MEIWEVKEELKKAGIQIKFRQSDGKAYFVPASIINKNPRLKALIGKYYKQLTGQNPQPKSKPEQQPLIQELLPILDPADIAVDPFRSKDYKDADEYTKTKKVKGKEIPVVKTYSKEEVEKLRLIYNSRRTMKIHPTKFNKTGNELIAKFPELHKAMSHEKEELEKKYYVYFSEGTHWFISEWLKAFRPPSDKTVTDFDDVLKLNYILDIWGNDKYLNYIENKKNAFIKHVSESKLMDEVCDWLSKHSYDEMKRKFPELKQYVGHCIFWPVKWEMIESNHVVKDGEEYERQHAWLIAPDGGVVDPYYLIYPNSIFWYNGIPLL